MFTRDPGAPFGTPNVVIGRQGRNELTLSFRPPPYLSRLLYIVGREGCPNDVFCDCEFEGLGPKDGCLIAPGVPAPEPEPAAFAPQGLPIHLGVSFGSAPSHLSFSFAPLISCLQRADE